MTDNEIIKALECCRHVSCVDGCPLDGEIDCGTKLVVNALDLIQRQQERIERLKDNLDAVLAERADHTEAIEEFADRIVEQLEEQTAYVGCSFAPKEKMTKIIKTDKAIAIVKGVQNDY